MKILINGVIKDLHYTIASKMIKSGQGVKVEDDEPIEGKKIVKKPGRKKIVKDTGKKK